MLIVSGTTRKLQVVTGSAASVKVNYSLVRNTSGVVTVPEPVNFNITTAATIDVLGSPGSGIQDTANAFTIFNDHASTSNAIIIQHTDGTVIAPLWKGVLLAGEFVVLTETGEWNKYGADGVLKAVSLLTFQQLAAVAVGAVSAAETDTLKLFARKIAGRMTPMHIAPFGAEETFQDKLSESGSVIYLPNNGTTVGLNLGVGWTTGGTVSHPTPASTAPAIYNQQKRTRWANVVTTTNQVLGLRTVTTEKNFWRGNASGLGGFNFHARFAIGLWPAATVRLFVGLNDSNAGWVISDTLTGNGCGLWHDTTEAATVLNFVTRDGTTATKAAITLATALAAGQCFDFWMWSAPNGGVIGYRLVEINTGTLLVDTTTSTTIPLTTAFLGPEITMSNGTANVTVTTTAFELSGHSCQSDK